MSNVVDVTERLRRRRVAAEFCERARGLDDEALAQLLASDDGQLAFVEAAPDFDAQTRRRVVAILIRHGAGRELVT